MFTVYLNSEDEGHSIKSFEKKMIKICEKHKKNKRALAFAFLIYDFTNPNLWKVLNDREYWLALNQISGKHLTVFSLNYKPKERNLFKKRRAYSDGFENMTSIRYSHNLTDDSNKIAEKYFDGIKLTFPSLLFFQVDKNSVTDSLLIKLKEKNIEDSFNEVKEYIEIAVDSLNKVEDENKTNFKEMFDLIAGNVKAKHSNLAFKRVIKDAGPIITLLSSFKKLLF